LAPTCNGFSAGFLWVCQGKYINDCASEKNKGLYNSIFLLCTFGFAFIFGNLMSTELIKYYSETILFMVLASVSLCTTIFLCFLKMPRAHDLVDEEDKEPTFSEIGQD
jgi:MFS family permease